MNEPAPSENPPPPENPPNVMPLRPPAATIVVEGSRTETEIALQTELDAERARHARTADEKKQRETRVSELEDEMHRLKKSQEPAPRAKRTSFGWFEEEE